MMSVGEEGESSGEISPESLQALNELLAAGPSEDASEEEVASFMAQFEALPGGGAMLQSVRQQLEAGGGEFLQALLGQGIPAPEEDLVKELYRSPRSPMRLVFRIEEKGCESEPRWRRLTLPSDASFYDLHLALQDVFGIRSPEVHRFEWRLGVRVEAVFLSGEETVAEGDDYCEFQNRPIDLFSEQVEEYFYCLGGSEPQEFVVQMEKVIAQGSTDWTSSLQPQCLSGADGGLDFEPSHIIFRDPLGA